MENFTNDKFVHLTSKAFMQISLVPISIVYDTGHIVLLQINFLCSICCLLSIYYLNVKTIERLVIYNYNLTHLVC